MIEKEPKTRSNPCVKYAGTYELLLTLSMGVRSTREGAWMRLAICGLLLELAIEEGNLRIRIIYVERLAALSYTE